MQVDSVSTGTQSSTAVDALKAQQNQAQPADKTVKHQHHHHAPKDVVTVSPEAKQAAASAQNNKA